MNPIFLAEAAPGTHPTIQVCGFSLGGFQICAISWESLLSSAIAALLTVIIVMAVAYRVSHGVPGKLQWVLEFLLGYVRQLTGETVDVQTAGFVIPLASTIALFILIANWLDFLPLTGPVHPANADLNQTLAMALIVFFVVQWYSIKVQGIGGSLRRFTKPFEMNIAVRILFVPLNLIEEFVKPVTLSLRLFGNIFAGVLMIYLLGLLFSWGFAALSAVQNGFGVLAVVGLIIWKAFDVFFVGTIQAFIFMLLTIIYFGQAREGMEEHGHHGQVGQAAGRGADQTPMTAH